MRFRWIFRAPALALAAVALIIGLSPAAAQEPTDSDRLDLIDLAVRLLNYPAEPTLPPITPLYEPGDTLEFWVGKAGQDTPTRVSATLAGAAPSVYLWVEEGLDYNLQAMQVTAQRVNNLASLLRWRGTYRPSDPNLGPLNQIFDPFDVFPLPDVDADPHLYILYSTDLIDDRDAVYNPFDSLPEGASPGGYGNQHELLVVNTSPYVGRALSDDLYLSILLRGIFNLVMNTNFPDQAPWLREALGWFLVYQFQQTPVTVSDVRPFFAAPDTPLLRKSTLTTRAQTYGAHLLFLSYLAQRYGTPVLMDLFTSEGDGMAPVERVLEAHDVYDPVSGEAVTADQAFADFVLTNALNAIFGDGRYIHLGVDLPNDMAATAIAASNADGVVIDDQAVNQYGAFYLDAAAAQAGLYRLTFKGVTTSPRLPIGSDSDAENMYYWSGSAANRDATLTRAFDLSDVDRATLRFDVWHDLAEAWNYGYVEVSTDGGATWSIIETTDTSRLNRNGVAYGPGFTGISNPLGPRPFPVLGVVIAADGMTITDVVPDGPAAQAGVEIGDLIIGYDGEPWPRMPNILGLLERYSPDDTLNLWIQRGEERLDIPVVLGAHPTRVLLPEPLWLPQEADLTPYAGQSILVRFETVRLPGHTGQGMAVDNIAIPEIGFEDDASADGEWTANGWQRVNNQVPQRYIVQAAATGHQNRAPRILSIIAPGDDATSGTLTLDLARGERVIVAVSPISQETLQPATFDLQIELVG